jgi:oxalate decarboxylase/phosphoglucose isomerase-like protein (cupin superfamily)
MIGGRSCHLIFTNKGYLRGEDSHPVASFTLMISGSGRWTIRNGKGKNQTLVQRKNEKVILPANKIHRFEALEDSVMIEWLDREGPFDAYYDKKLRAALALANEKLTEKLGKRRQPNPRAR